MNLLLLVEGAETEPRVYEAWLRQRLPRHQRVAQVADLNTDQYALIRGRGYPSCYRRVGALLRDIHDHAGKVGEFWLCLDSDEATFDERHDEALALIQREASQIDLARSNPALTLRVIVQHCCIETWFLGHEGFLRAGPQARELVAFKRFYDVSKQDPEHMGTFPGYVTRASFHLAYLKAMLAERSHRYSKQHPGVVLEASYLAALEARCLQTGHMRSLQRLLTLCRGLSPPSPQAG